MAITGWWLPAAALVLVGSAATGLLIGREAGTPTQQRQQPAMSGITAENGKRLLLTAEQRREARFSGSWLRDVTSLLRVDKPMSYGDFVWDDRKVPDGDVWIRVDLRTQLMSVFKGGHEIGTAVVLYGADGKETPLGTFPILWKGKDHVSSLYDAPMPYTLRLTGDGVAIHGSDVRWGAATHGCVGIPKEFAARIFALARIGDQVSIVRTEPSSATPQSRTKGAVRGV